MKTILAFIIAVTAWAQPNLDDVALSGARMDRKWKRDGFGVVITVTRVSLIAPFTPSRSVP